MNTFFNFIAQLLVIIGLMQCLSSWYSHRPSWFPYSSFGPLLMCDKLNWKKIKTDWFCFTCLCIFSSCCLVLRRHYQFSIRKLVLFTLIPVINGVFLLFDQNKFVWRHTTSMFLCDVIRIFLASLFRVAVACVT